MEIQPHKQPAAILCLFVKGLVSTFRTDDILKSLGSYILSITAVCWTCFLLVFFSTCDLIVGAECRSCCENEYHFVLIYQIDQIG